MSTVMSLQSWLKKTNLGALHSRGPELQLVDRALKAYHQSPNGTTKRALIGALESWMASKPDWKQSGRNKYGAVEDLHNQLHGIGQPKALEDAKERAAEAEAFQFLDEQRKQAARRLFTGTRLEPKKSFLLSFAANRASNLKTIHDTYAKVKPVVGVAHHGAKVVKHTAPVVHHATPMIVSQASHIAQQLATHIHDLIVAIVHPAVILDVMHALGQSFIGELAHALAPYVGHVSSGGRAIYSWGKAFYQKYQEIMAGRHGVALLPGDATAALAAVQKLIGREALANAASGVRLTTEFGVRTAMTALEWGGPLGSTLTGAASALVSVIQEIIIVGRDYYERYLANKVLAQPEKINFRIFETHPILGCYLLTCADTSDLVNMVTADFGKSGWKGDVEYLVKKHIKPLQDTANGYLYGARFELQGLKSNKGTIPTGFVDRLSFNAIQFVKGN